MSALSSRQIRLPDLATHTGWNLRHPQIGAPGLLLNLTGATVPFAATKEERDRVARRLTASPGGGAAAWRASAPRREKIVPRGPTLPLARRRRAPWREGIPRSSIWFEPIFPPSARCPPVVDPPPWVRSGAPCGLLFFAVSPVSPGRLGN